MRLVVLWYSNDGLWSGRGATCIGINGRSIGPLEKINEQKAVDMSVMTAIPFAEGFCLMGGLRGSAKFKV